MAHYPFDKPNDMTIHWKAIEEHNLFIKIALGENWYLVKCSQNDDNSCHDNLGSPT
jgi:hypothetical protein